MEFFKEVAIKTDVKRLQDSLSIQNLAKLCASIDNIIEDNIRSGVIYCLWGQFDINREEIVKGIRFSLPNCHNGLVWSITIEDELDEQLLIYCTINKSHHEMEFVDSIHEFVSDWQLGLEQYFNES